ncbi:hypothetical protein ABBQ38_009786 [Trebouxia sp. C0009 RCD-2024]
MGTAMTQLSLQPGWRPTTPPESPITLMPPTLPVAKVLDKGDIAKQHLNSASKPDVSVLWRLTMGGVVATASLLEFLPTLPDSQDSDTTVYCVHSNYLTERTLVLSVIAVCSCASRSYDWAHSLPLYLHIHVCKRCLGSAICFVHNARVLLLSVHNTVTCQEYIGIC